MKRLHSEDHKNIEQLYGQITEVTSKWITDKTNASELPHTYFNAQRRSKIYAKGREKFDNEDHIIIKKNTEKYHQWKMEVLQAGFPKDRKTEEYNTNIIQLYIRIQPTPSNNKTKSGEFNGYLKLESNRGWIFYIHDSTNGEYVEHSVIDRKNAIKFISSLKDIIKPSEYADNVPRPTEIEINRPY